LEEGNRALDPTVKVAWKPKAEKKGRLSLGTTTGTHKQEGIKKGPMRSETDVDRGKANSIKGNWFDDQKISSQGGDLCFLCAWTRVSGKEPPAWGIKGAAGSAPHPEKKPLGRGSRSRDDLRES